MSLSKDSEKCKNCEYYNNCDTKRMVACAIAEKDQLSHQDNARSLSMPLAKPLIKTENDLIKEQIEKEIERELHKELYYCDLMFGG